jgi:hypothetical protein
MLLAALALPGFSHAADLRPPADITAGTGFTIASSGSGRATFYLIGPGSVVKHEIALGEEITVKPDEAKDAGRYMAIVCGADGCTHSGFDVHAAQPQHVSFMLHPSRVPVSARGATHATAFVFDKYFNPVFTPVRIEFRIVPKSGAPFSRTVETTRGASWIQMDSTPREGPVKVTAAVGQTAETRIVQQVASEACNLRIKATRSPKGVLIETDPVRDCSGNMVPDGTVVSFTSTDHKGKTTVDAPIKKGIARTELPVSGSARISVASGVVTGNEISLGGRS